MQEIFLYSSNLKLVTLSWQNILFLINHIDNCHPFDFRIITEVNFWNYFWWKPFIFAFPKKTWSIKPFINFMYLVSNKTPWFMVSWIIFRCYTLSLIHIRMFFEDLDPVFQREFESLWFIPEGRAGGAWVKRQVEE